MPFQRSPELAAPWASAMNNYEAILPDYLPRSQAEAKKCNAAQVFYVSSDISYI